MAIIVTFVTGIRWSALSVLAFVVAGCGGLGTRVASEVASPTERRAAGERFGFVTAVDPERRTITFDPAEWLSGEEANRAGVAAGVIQPGDTVPNDHLIQNPSRRTRVLKVAPDALITATALVSQFDVPPPARCRTDFCASYPVTVDAFFASFGGPDPCKCLWKFWLTIRDGQVIRLDEQYTP